jgi:hypothetical protein
VEPRSEAGGRRVRCPQDLLAGLLVIALAIALLFALSRIRETSYQAISPSLFPRLCAYGLMLGGVILAARGVLRDGPGLEAIPWRAAALVTLAIVLFGVLTPVAGYAVAGFCTLLVSGLAATDLRLRDLVATSIGLIVFSVLLFSVVLKLTIPVVRLPGLSF